ncbi:alpha/beta hydrolase [Pseudoalteromonas phenolica]|uniref:Serine aminopeptidase S33 domain-containing protein n=1 Tax=Pseudoalteromonas phenolica TaxID=161398 RepID=A0A0S2JXW6_9GAMM|nr:alpha/beta fold hydrolase [Pseudoalteromonas phenolica]ALO40873.1 hypothetical protein PP2015_347 [Pseudoalteromonas phenolica]RXF05302.1 alpha/beta hydrolase [Pseudoalteromonas phenolica O-BC30]
MKFNYFNNKRRRIGLQSITRFLSSGLTSLPPKMSLSVGSKLLLNPFGKRNYDFELVSPDEVHNIETSLGLAHVAVFGEGEQLILISHGWADNSSGFEAMIAHFIEQGFKVAAIDHIAHGKSSGKQSHLLNFIETITATVQYFEQRNDHIHAIVAHSMGAVATLNLPIHLLEDKKLVLIATPVKFFELMFEKVDAAGISPKLLIHVLEGISAQFGKHWKTLCLTQHTEKLTDKLYFIHDEQDRFACYKSVSAFLNNQKPSLFTTQGLGHRKLLGDTKVIEHITKVITS